MHRMVDGWAGIAAEILTMVPLVVGYFGKELVTPLVFLLVLETAGTWKDVQCEHVSLFASDCNF